MAEAAISRGAVLGKTLFCVPDRGEAISYACTIARRDDVVIACGKGHEQSMCFGTIEYPWDDRTAMRAALRGGGLRTLPTAKHV
jgi:UDP-N-acetylmuramoyl-L-alanyl-D-glutamate--2,6-diaminopimelate ligase